MAIRNLDQAESGSSKMSAPFCVIGAGMAGLLLAHRLAKRGRGVILVESGHTVYDPDIHRLNEIENASGRYKWAISGRYRGLGGTSTRWGGRMISLSQDEADPRPDLSLPGWPFPLSELEAYNSDIEQIFRLDPGSFESGQDIGGPPVLSRADPDFTCRWAKWATYKRGNLAVLLRDFLENSSKIDVLLGATVCGFSLDCAGGRILEVKARSLRGREIVVRADHFVFAAGTFETTRLLLLLDAGSEGRVFGQCRVLGRYFQDHLDAQVGQLSPKDRAKTSILFSPKLVGAGRRSPHLELTSAAKKSDAVASAFVHVTANLSEHPTYTVVKKLVQGNASGSRRLSRTAIKRLTTDIPLLSHAGLWFAKTGRILIPEDVEIKLRVCIEQTPQWANRICLSETRDPLGVPRIKLFWSPTDCDERTFRSVSKRIASYWARSGLDEICPVKWRQGLADDTGAVTDQAQDFCHPSGTTRMGLDPVESVVGPDLRCHHIANASVVGAATFPTAGSVNPTFSILQLALRCADGLLKTA